MKDLIFGGDEIHVVETSQRNGNITIGLKDGRRFEITATGYREIKVDQYVPTPHPTRRFSYQKIG